MIKRSITLKLTAGFVFIVMISTLLIGVIAINIFKNNIFQIKEKTITQHAKEMEVVLAPYIESNTVSKEYKDILNIVTAVDNTKVWIVNLKGEINTIYKYKDTVVDKSPELQKAYSEIIKGSLQGKGKTIQEYNSYYDENMMTAAVPIKANNNNVIGVILVHSSTYDLLNSMNIFFLYLIAALLGEIIIAGLLGFYFSKNITKPIKIINEAALKMTGGNYKVRTNIYQKDEIGELSNSFDLLSSKLEFNIGQLFVEKNKLIDIITSMKEGLIALDKDFKLININDSALEMLSLNIYDHNVLETVGLKMVIENSLKVNEKKTILKNYGDKNLNFSVSPVLNNIHEITGVVIIIQDISEQEKLEQMRKDFVANVSHEFRTPLTIIRGNLEGLYDKVIPEEEVNDNYFRLLQETKRLEIMVKDLLDLSKLEAGKVALDFQKLDIKALLQDIVRVLKPITREKNIELELIAEDNLPPVWSDYDKLKQLLIIFIDNAIKFSCENSKIQLVIHLRETLSITITDYGIGISKEAIPFIGERFYKADKARKYADKGTGLGLSIAKHLIKLLNCEMKIESEVNVGTEIKINFLKVE
ncbi:MAG: HAMP domain-containing protein [Clostridiaceae bacterium]|nr:HAMP domain-containing protein [Clostridiaceae bacterium]